VHGKGISFFFELLHELHTIILHWRFFLWGDFRVMMISIPLTVVGSYDGHLGI